MSCAPLSVVNVEVSLTDSPFESLRPTLTSFSPLETWKEVKQRKKTIYIYLHLFIFTRKFAHPGSSEWDNRPSSLLVELGMNSLLGRDVPAEVDLAAYPFLAGLFVPDRLPEFRVLRDSSNAWPHQGVQVGSDKRPLKDRGPERELGEHRAPGIINHLARFGVPTDLATYPCTMSRSCRSSLELHLA
ncbi:hypothetical protein BDK51DRAFT_50872 [Blyttiomyces helicus]|uniref:Uncharacterized protein n=1 Tax=Blyttiomyces helicus TaxID=388810 RepID=A0A4P9W6A3_9FUNG|nr:hypothetical protein BDK51DRAFT_50872 [Blyttiomyces helicus]|eukprot:RKO87981.1 hypothetical protein BDK51DRAFT_50872 [Blyttiomyces helicus]